MIKKIKYHLFALVSKFFMNVFVKNVSIGSKTTWRRKFNLISEGGKINIGNNCFFNNECSIVSRGNIQIGNYSIFGENVKIYDHNHRFNKINQSIKEQGYSIGTVQIGNNCWIGSNVVILKGTKIGDNCVIGAGCIIDFDIPSGTIVKLNNTYVCEEIRYV